MLTRREQAALARKSIVAAAEKLIKEKGYDDIRITDITSACDMTPGNFYHYFKSKEELFTELDTNKFYGSFSAFQPDANLSVLDRLSSYIHEWIELMIHYYGSNYSYYWIRHYTHHQQSSDGPGTNDNRISLMSGHILSFLEKGIENNELRKETPVECIAFSIAFSILGCSAYFGFVDDGEFVQRWAEDYCEVYIRNALAPYCVK